MSTFSSVVVGLDGSRAAEAALRWAATRLVEPSEIHVVHAGAPDPTLPEDLAGSTTITTIHSEDARPSAALISTATSVGADAIVVGPHGAGRARHLGTVTKELLRDSPVPVVVVDGIDPPRSVGLRPPVVACVGYGEPAGAAARWAAAFADARGLPLVLLHAVAYRSLFPIDSASDVLASYLGAEVSAEWAMDELRGLGAALREKYHDLTITAHVERSSVIGAIQHAGEQAELVVLGMRSEEEFLHGIGNPRLRRLVARSQFPTAVVPVAVEDA